MLAGAPTGLYGHVEENRKRSILLFAGFILAIELMALVMLIGPTLLWDWNHSPLVAPLGYLARYALPVALIGFAIYAAKLWWFVGGVKKSVGFRYVDNDDEPRFCRILEPLAVTAAIPTPYAAVIDTPAMNAFACGVRANHMVVVATRGLIDGLDDDELAAVLAHEVTHIKNRDTMLLASANTFMATLKMTQTKRQVRLDDWRQAVGMVLFPVFIPLSLLLAFLNQLALRIGYCSRAAIGSAREYIADAEAARLTKNPAALVSALRKIEGRSRIEAIGTAEEAMMIDGPVDGPLATHPAVAERIAALARTTGSMVFEGGTRLDTRADPIRRAAQVQGFGRRDDELMRIATLAEAPPRAGLWEIFRKTRDPNRNLFGFNSRATVMFGSALIAIGLIATTTPGAAYFAAQRQVVPALGSLGKMTTALARCQAGVLVPGVGPCNAGALNSSSDALMKMFGIPAMSTGNSGTFSAGGTGGYGQLVDARLRRRCYVDRFDLTPAALTGPAQGNAYGEQLATYRRGAEKDNDAILLAAPGPARDRALKDYVALRKLLLNDALYFFGKSGMDELNQLYARDDHKRVIALLGERIKDPAFVRGEQDSEVADYHLFAKAPFDALPCDVALDRR